MAIQHTASLAVLARFRDRYPEPPWSEYADIRAAELRAEDEVRRQAFEAEQQRRETQEAEAIRQREEEARAAAERARRAPPQLPETLGPAATTAAKAPPSTPASLPLGSLAIGIGVIALGAVFAVWHPWQPTDTPPVREEVQPTVSPATIATVAEPPKLVGSAMPAPPPKQVAVTASPCRGVQVDVVGAGRRCLDPADAHSREFEDCVTTSGKRLCAPAMVALPKGTYRRGSEGPFGGKPVKPVTIGYHLAVGKYEVTFAEWEACVDDGGCKHKPRDEGWGRDDRPVIHASWDDVAEEYLPWLNRRLGLSGAGAYRLLTEAEWEYAARGVTSASAQDFNYWWGDEASHEHANYGADTCCSGLARRRDKWVNTAPVGQFPQNPFGLHDMHGNVWEWVQDCYADTYNSAPTNGSRLPETNACRRVIRGGSWSFAPGYLLHSASRNWSTAGSRSNNLGFRLARTLSP